MATTYPQPLLGSTVRAISVIRALQRNTHPLSVSDIGRMIGVDYDRAYRTLVTLESEGIVHRVGAYARLWCLSDGVTIPPRRRQHVKTA